MASAFWLLSQKLIVQSTGIQTHKMGIDPNPPLIEKRP